MAAKRTNAKKIEKGINADRHLCKTCMYRTSDSVTKTVGPRCYFILIEGHRRGCPASDCNVYKKGKRVSLKDV